MAKRGYKQGAMSATDAITQLRAAAAKCDDKWMKAHAASARFFGAREADVKHALKRCGTVKSSLMGAKPRKRKRGIGMFDQVAASMEPGDERDYTITIERGYKGHPGYTGDMRGLGGTEAQHTRAGLDFLSAADRALARANTAGADRERHAGALEAFRLATHAHAECSWEPMGSGPDCVQSADALAKRAKKLLGERIDGPAVRGLKGSSPQHMEAGLEYLSLARNILARAEAAPAYTEKRQDEALKALHYATEAVGECGWAPQEGLACRREGRELVERATRLVKKRVESTGRGVKGLKGSSPQHFERAKAHFSAADEELEWGASPAARGSQKRLLAKASRQLTAGMVNCDWVRSKKAKQVCYAEEKRLIRKLAKLEGNDRVFTDGFALDGTRKRRRRKR